MNERGGSVARKGKTFAVAASPFNGVKLELGIVLALGLVVVLGVTVATISTAAQIIVLLSYGLGAMIWLVARTRRILRRQTERHGTTPGPSDAGAV
jgi:hypothetical protein